MDHWALKRRRNPYFVDSWQASSQTPIAYRESGTNLQRCRQVRRQSDAVRDVWSAWRGRSPDANRALAGTLTSYRSARTRPPSPPDR